MSHEAQIEVRPASEADESAIIRCVTAAYGPYLSLMDQKPAPMLDDYHRLISDGCVRVAESDGAIVGVIVMWPRRPPWRTIEAS